MPFPSFKDPDLEVAASFNGVQAFPTTAFYDRKGELAYCTRAGTSRRATSSTTSTSTLADVLEVRPAHSDDELVAALDLRERVFCGEQGVSLEADRDGRDPEASTWSRSPASGWSARAGCCFEGPLARLGRLVVEPELRGARRRPGDPS